MQCRENTVFITKDSVSAVYTGTLGWNEVIDVFMRWPKDPSLSQFSVHGSGFSIDKCVQLHRTVRSEQTQS